MTGFGRGQSQIGGSRIIVELRTLNHKFQDIRLHLPPELLCLEETINKKIRLSFIRGRIDLSVRYEGSGGQVVRLDKDLAQSCLKELKQLSDDLGLSEPVSLDILSTIPQVFQVEALHDPEDQKTALLDAVDQAITAAQSMRGREGKTLETDFESRLNEIERYVRQIRDQSSTIAESLMSRLKLRVQKLIQNEEIKLDEDRLEMEVALLADKSDIAEELTRLVSHVDQFRKISAEKGAVGKRLDFLIQEMAREASTIGAKGQDAPLRHLIVDLKGELSRMKEQIQNIE